MTEHDFMTSPGMSFKALLCQARPASLQNILNKSIVDVIGALDPELLSQRQFGELASHLIEPSNALRDSNVRNHIIRLLPLPKARELAKRLGVEDGRALYDNISKAASKKIAIPILFSFFGVVHDIRAPKNSAPSVDTAIASYALFDHQRRAAQKAKRLLSNHPHKTVLHMPTGSGVIVKSGVRRQDQAAT